MPTAARLLTVSFLIGMASFWESFLVSNGFAQGVRVAFYDTDASEAELTPEQAERKSNLQRCLAIYYTRQVDANVLRPWSIMHGLIGFGQETQVVVRGKPVDAVTYLCDNGIGDDRRILFTRDGKIKTRIGPGVQGHAAQLLAMLAQSDVSIDHPMTVDGQSFSVRDLVEHEKESCRSATELTFRLLSLSHYVDLEATWTNESGDRWSVERLLKEELEEPVNQGACGGSHRLMALAYAVRQRRLAGLPIDGHWRRADKFIKDYQQYVWSLQNDNGSFGPDWFVRKSKPKDAEGSLYTTGHILEWLVYSLPEDEIKDPRVASSVDFILNVLLSAPNYDLAVGPRGHALRALRIYQQRVFEKSDFRTLLDDPEIVSNNPQNGGGKSAAKSGDLNPGAKVQRHIGIGRRRGRFGRRW